MDLDHEHRCFRFIQADVTTDVSRLVSGWLDLVVSRFPNAPAAVVEGDYLAYLPGGASLKEVSFKREHQAVGLVLSEWSSSVMRLVGRVVGDKIELDDGRRYPLDQVRFVRLEDA